MFHRHFFRHKSHVNWPEVEFGPQRWEAGVKSSELCHGCIDEGAILKTGLTDITSVDVNWIELTPVRDHWRSVNKVPCFVLRHSWTAERWHGLLKGGHCVELVTGLTGCLMNCPVVKPCCKCSCNWGGCWSLEIGAWSCELLNSWHLRKENGSFRMWWLWRVF